MKLLRAVNSLFFGDEHTTATDVYTYIAFTVILAFMLGSYLN